MALHRNSLNVSEILHVKEGSDVNRTEYNFYGLIYVLHFPIKLLFRLFCCSNHYWLLSRDHLQTPFKIQCLKKIKTRAWHNGSHL